MKKFVIVVAIMAALLVVARADGLSFSVTPTPFGGIDYGFSGGPSGHHGSGGCNGTFNFSSGCTAGMIP